MRPTGGDVGAFLRDVTPAGRRTDAETLVELMSEISGRPPVLWGTIVGFGACHYVYPTGTEGDMPVLAFAPRRQATTVYLESTDAYAAELARLGPHTVGRGCLYIKRLDDVDPEVLRDILTRSRAWCEAGGSEGIAITVTE